MSSMESDHLSPGSQVRETGYCVHSVFVVHLKEIGGCDYTKCGGTSRVAVKWYVCMCQVAREMQ